MLLSSSSFHLPIRGGGGQIHIILGHTDMGLDGPLNCLLVSWLKSQWRIQPTYTINTISEQTQLRFHP